MHDSFWFLWFVLILFNSFWFQIEEDTGNEAIKAEKKTATKHYNLQIKLRSEKWELGHTFVHWRRLDCFIAQNRDRPQARAQSTIGVTMSANLQLEPPLEPRYRSKRGREGRRADRKREEQIRLLYCPESRSTASTSRQPPWKPRYRSKRGREGRRADRERERRNTNWARDSRERERERERETVTLVRSENLRIEEVGKLHVGSMSFWLPEEACL